ncbi:hypothetical protein N7481_007650 [Penicillium waksmanii]|uniref:uncharacterized protein n=1 Tax=Penicillium waksmanii TaxID=69791 RepID=UPI002548F5A4|nr:uncharacterized protein N7481_007650 [Penicillium waksmanii]KAJ5980352.1 hypothetical protein N7481_007650 [Penicillium waksmanii]
MPDDMSMIPYNGGNLDVVLRHNDSVVVLDRDSQQLALRNAADAHEGNLEFSDCPWCHRPMRDSSRGRHRGTEDPEAEFVNPNYFRMLNNSLPSSASSSRPPSPRRRLVQPALPRGITSAPSQPAPAQAPPPQGISSAAFSQDYFKRFFVEEKELGKGGKGVVLLVKHMLDGVSLGHYACKRVPVGDDHEWLEKVLGEVQLLQHLSHQNLVSYRHVWLENAKISTFGPPVACAFILQQYCNAGDLHNYIYGSVQTSTTAQQLKDRLRRKSRGEPESRAGLGGPRILQLDEIYSFFRDITSGLRHLHMNGYIHRDLKPNNCLLHDTSDGIRVLVSDFGEVQQQNAIRKSTGATGTVSFCAPEVLRQDFPDGPFGNFSFKSDIFSLGMILYFLCFAELPYASADIVHEENEDLDQLRAEITGWTGFDNARRRRPDLPEKLYTFLERLLAVDPNRRPTADEVLNGIQAGATGSFRFKRSSSVSPDLPGGPRIHPADSPQPSMERALSPTKKLPAHSSQLAYRRDSMFDSNGSGSGSSRTPDQDAGLENPPSSMSPDRNIIVRQQRYSTTSPPVSPSRPSHEDTPTPSRSHSPVRPQHLLPPPESISTLRHPDLYLLTRSTTFPLPTESSLGLPPLLTASAAATFGIHDVRLQISALVAHILVVGIGMRFGVLCAWRADSNGDTSPWSSL